MMSLRHRHRDAKQRPGMEDLERLMLAPIVPTPEARARESETAALLDRAIEALRTAKPALYEVLRGQLDGVAVSEVARELGIRSHAGSGK